MRLPIAIIFLSLYSLSCFAEERPNIIVMIADDLNASLGVMGGAAKTTHLDALAKAGVMFSNAQVNSPICGPSRASLLTGLAPHTTGYYGYNFIDDHWRNNPILRNAVSIPEHFRANGYQILITGKIYHNNQEDTSMWYKQGIPPSWGPWPWDGTPDNGYEHGTLSAWRNSIPHPDMPEGFGIDNAFASLAQIPNVPAKTKKNIPGYEGWRLFYEPFNYEKASKRDLMPDELNADWVTKQLKTKYEKPFLMFVGFNRPHTPMYVPQEYLDLYPLNTIKPPEKIENDLEDLAEGFKPSDAAFSTQGYGYFKYDQVMEQGEIFYKKWLQSYLAGVTLVDDQVGKIIKALENSRYAKNTYVVFTSDHGYHIGEKNMLFKNSPWEPSAQVPFIIAGPNVEKNVIQRQPISLIDLFPTLIDWANIPTQPNIGTNKIELDGYSLSPLLKRETNEEWQGRAVALTTVASKDEVAMAQPGKVEQQHHSIRSERYRYILSSLGGEELYDHQSDPNEWHNLAKEKKYAEIKDYLRAELRSIVGF